MYFKKTRQSILNILENSQVREELKSSFFVVKEL